MNHLAEIVTRSGILPQDTLAEFRRWKLPVPDLEGEPITKVEEVIEALEITMQSEGFVLTRETDLEILQLFLRTAKVSVLHLISESEKGEDVEVDVSCLYAVTKLGEYIVPHRGEHISDVIANGKTHLDVGMARIFFKEARELFYGEHKAFLVCSPSVAESARNGGGGDGPH